MNVIPSIKLLKKYVLSQPHHLGDVSFGNYTPSPTFTQIEITSSCGAALRHRFWEEAFSLGVIFQANLLFTNTHLELVTSGRVM